MLIVVIPAEISDEIYISSAAKKLNLHITGRVSVVPILWPKVSLGLARILSRLLVLSSVCLSGLAFNNSFHGGRVFFSPLVQFSVRTEVMVIFFLNYTHPYLSCCRLARGRVLNPILRKSVPPRLSNPDPVYDNNFAIALTCLWHELKKDKLYVLGSRYLLVLSMYACFGLSVYSSLKK